MTAISPNRSSDPIIRLEHVRRDAPVTESAVNDNVAVLASAWSPTRSVDNVLLFLWRRQDGAARRAPIPELTADERPTPALTRTDSRRRIWLVVLSLFVHLGFFALSWNEVEPLESVTVEAISIEIVLGGQTVAGMAEKPQEVEAELAPAAEPVKPEEQLAEQQQPATQQPQETPVAERETAPQVQQAEDARETAREEQPKDATAEATPQVQTAEATPQVQAAEATPQMQMAEATPQTQPAEVTPQMQAAEVTPESQTPEVTPQTQAAIPMVETPVAEIPTVKPAEKPAEMEAVITPPRAQPQPAPKPKAAPKGPVAKREVAAPKREVGPERTRIAAPTSQQQTQSSAAPKPTPPPSAGVGIGRSANDPNYRALVAAHLQRFKQYPADARAGHQQGAGSVTFSIDGGGRVTSASVSRGTGVGSLDRELAAMVRRASPFPAPPRGRGMSFSVPVNFRLQ